MPRVVGVAGLLTGLVGVTTMNGWVFLICFALILVAIPLRWREEDREAEAMAAEAQKTYRLTVLRRDAIPVREVIPPATYDR